MFENLKAFVAWLLNPEDIIGLRTIVLRWSSDLDTDSIRALWYLCRISRWLRLNVQKIRRSGAIYSAVDCYILGVQQTL